MIHISTSAKWSLNLITMLFAGQLLAQQVAIQEESEQPHSSAMLDIQSYDKGLLIPRLTSDERTAIVSPAHGLMVFDTDLQSMMMYTGTEWENQAEDLGNNIWSRVANGIAHTLPSKWGINSTNPTDEIHVQAPGNETNSMVRLESNNQSVFTLKNQTREYQWIYDNQSTVLSLRDIISSSDRLRVEPGIKISIGGGAATESIHVKGSLRATGTISSPSIKGLDLNGNVITYTRYLYLRTSGGLPGQATIFGPNQTSNIEMGSSDPQGNVGKLYLNNSSGTPKVKMHYETWNYHPVGITEVDYATCQRIELFPHDPIGIQGTAAYFKQPNGNNNIEIRQVYPYDDAGWVSVHDQNGTWKGRFFIGSNSNYEDVSVVQADEKNFRMDHPLDAEKEIWYGSIEGPEAAMYWRGTTQLDNGRAVITLPDHFAAMGTDDNITVMVTPLDKKSKGLTVIEKSNTHFTVGELQNGTGNYAFDWEIKALRKGYESFRPVRSKSERLTVN